ncbi:hypothetical protein ACFFRR_005463 [Megaselia abdita]
MQIRFGITLKISTIDSVIDTKLKSLETQIKTAALKHEQKKCKATNNNRLNLFANLNLSLDINHIEENIYSKPLFNKNTENMVILENENSIVNSKVIDSLVIEKKLNSKVVDRENDGQKFEKKIIFCHYVCFFCLN